MEHGTDRKLRIGIIGCGKIAQIRHAPEYLSAPHAELTACCDANPAAAQSFSSRFGCRAYTDLDALLQDCSIDAVSVCVPNHLHADYTIRALRAGKHVLCEKPMATDLSACEKMVREAERSGKTLMIGQNQRFLETHRVAERMIREGRIGRVLSFRTCFCHGGPEAWIGSSDPWFFSSSISAFGAILDLGVHKIDLICDLLHTVPLRVRALTATLDKRLPDGSPIPVDDNAIGIFEMKDGSVGTVTASWTSYGEEDNSTILYGTEGILKLCTSPERSLILVRKDGTEESVPTAPIQTNSSQSETGTIRAFLEALLRGEEPPASGRELLPVMRGVFAAIRSSRTGGVEETGN